MNPEDILFYVGKEASYEDIDGEVVDGDVLVVMCPKDFFMKNGYVCDKHLGIQHLLPKSIIAECQEGMFDTSLNVEETREVLLNLGFVEDESFSNFCKNHDPFV